MGQRRIGIDQLDETVTDAIDNAGGGTNITNDGETDMAAASTFDDTTWPANVEWFTINFWAVNMSSSANDITLRLRDSGGIRTTGYDSDTMHDDGTTRTFANDTAHFEIPGFDGLSIVRGVLRGTRTSSVTDNWAVEGHFMDLGNSEIVTLHGNIDLNSDCEGFRIQSANGSNFTAGTLSVQYGI